MNLLLHDGPYWPSGPNTQIDYQSVESIESYLRSARSWLDQNPTDLYHKGAYDYLRAMLTDCYQGIDYGSAQHGTARNPEAIYPMTDAPAKLGECCIILEGQSEMEGEPS